MSAALIALKRSVHGTHGTRVETETFRPYWPRRIIKFLFKNVIFQSRNVEYYVKTFGKSYLRFDNKLKISLARFCSSLGARSELLNSTIMERDFCVWRLDVMTCFPCITRIFSTRLPIRNNNLFLLMRTGRKTNN